MSTRAAAALAFAALTVVPAAAEADTPPTLTVDGSGITFVVPDLASLSVDVSVTAARAAPALSLANQRTDAIVAGVRGLGVAASGLQTESVGVHRRVMHVGPKGRQRRIVRYVADEQLSITSSTALVGRVIDTAVHRGATGVDGPSFSFSDPTAGEIAATNAALVDARRRADAGAAQIGDKVTGVQSVNLSPQSSFGVAGSGASGSAAPAPAKSTPTTVRAGRQEVDATVEVVYTIAPA